MQFSINDMFSSLGSYSVQRAVASTGPRGAATFAEAMVTHYDQNGDAMLDADELSEYLSSRDSAAPWNMPAATTEPRAETIDDIWQRANARASALGFMSTDGLFADSSSDRRNGRGSSRSGDGNSLFDFLTSHTRSSSFGSVSSGGLGAAPAWTMRGL